MKLFLRVYGTELSLGFKRRILGGVHQKKAGVV
jgi:hypothetical protein